VTSVERRRRQFALRADLRAARPCRCGVKFDDVLARYAASPRSTAEPPPFDLTIPNPFQKYRFRIIDHSSPALSRTAAALLPHLNHRVIDQFFDDISVRSQMPKEIRESRKVQNI
jgi:hypothetical protein